MKEIKFRYTCKRDNGHVFSVIFSIEDIEAGDAQRWIEANLVGMFHLIRDQYTGLKDSKGVEIYEGDILDYHKHKGYLLSDFRASVGWLEGRGCFGYQIVDDHWHHEFTRHDELQTDVLNHLEVIGNIYESPHLLDSNSKLWYNIT